MNPLLSLIDEKIVRILKTFVKNKEKQMYLREIAKKSEVPPATTMRILKRLAKEKLIEEQRISRFTFYKYHKNQKIDEIIE